MSEDSKAKRTNADGPGEAEVIELRPANLTSPELEANRVQVNLQAPNLAFQVETQMPVSNQIIELSARLSVLSEMLDAAHSKLDNAMQRIGYLEAQVAQRDQIIDLLNRQSQDKAQDA